MKLYAIATFISLGLFLVIGTKCKLKFLVDPPERLSPAYTGSFIKKHFGTEFLIFTNYLFGFMFLIVGIIVIFGKYKVK